MSDPQDHSAYALRQLETEWSQARTAWNDRTTDLFEHYYMDPITSHSQAHARALDALMHTLRLAQAAARAR